MSTLTLEQGHALIAKLRELGRISAERDAASDASRAANVRWNAARTEYARVHAQIVAEFGEQNAPIWIESFHGKRAVPSEAGNA